MSYGRPPAELRARAGRWLIAASLLTSGLGLGGVHTEVLAVCAVLAASAMALTWWDAKQVEPRRASTILVMTAFVLLAWTLLQLIPLPRAMLATIAPANADVWDRALAPLRESGPSFVPITLDPSATRVQLLRGITYLAVFLGSARIAGQREGTLFLERAMVGAAVIVAGCAVLHPVLGAHKVFGLYTPRAEFAYDPHHISPLLNLNHLAAYVNIGTVLAFASVIEVRDAIPRPVAAVVVLLLAAVTTWTGSRGGIVAPIVGAAAVAVFAAARRPGASAGRRIIHVVGILGLGLVLYSAFDATRDKFAHNDLFKLSLVRNAFDLIPRYGILGIGRGSFESTFPELRRGQDYWVHTHPENIVAQWTTEWGVPSVIAGLAILWALRPRTALTRSRPPAGAWAVLLATALHNLVDFNSEIPAVMIALSVCAAIVTGGSAPRERLSGWARSPRTLVAAVAGATIAALAATLPFVDRELNNEQLAFRSFALDPAVSRADFEARARAAMSRHPAEPYFPFVGAVRNLVRAENPLSWVGRALERSPVHGRAHLVLARWLYRRNISQARLEYRVACEQDPEACKLDEAVALVRSTDDAMELVPNGVRGITALAFLTNGLGTRLPSTVVVLDRELVARDPKAVDPVRRVAAGVLLDVRNQESWCDDQRQSCIEVGLEAATRLRGAAPDQCEGHALTAELKVARSDADLDVALADFDRALDQVADRARCARRFVLLARSTNNAARLTAALDRLLKLGCGEESECVDNFLFAADIEIARGSTRHAIALLRKASERAPEREDVLVRCGDLAAAHGAHGDALDAYQRLMDRHPDEPRWREHVQRERAAIAKSLYERH